MVAPDRLGQRRLVDHAPRTAHEVVEDVVLLAHQLHLAARHLDPLPVGEEAHVAGVEALQTVALVAADDAPDAGRELGQVERLGQVVVGPELEPLDLVVERIARRDDNHPRTLAQLLEPLEQPQAAAARQHDVEQDAVVVVVLQLGQRRGIVGSLLHHVTLAAERPHHNLTQRGFILDNQQFHRIPSLFFCKDSAEFRTGTETSRRKRRRSPVSGAPAFKSIGSWLRPSNRRRPTSRRWRPRCIRRRRPTG